MTAAEVSSHDDSMPKIVISIIDVRLIGSDALFFNENYFDELLQEIREIRVSERNFYQKITDIYATSLDYNVASPITKEFFKTVQNKMHFAVHGNTAAEIIVNLANHKKSHMGLTNWKNSPDGFLPTL